MLQELSIKNIALIRDLSISFEEGLNILSGETGAGKSIIVDSVNLILGERSSKELIKSGEEKAYVEALFYISPSEKNTSLFSEYGFDGEELIVSRELTASGKNVCRINGRMVPLTFLKDFIGNFINLHGQNQQHQIFNEKHQLEMIDRFSGATIFDLIDNVKQAASLYHACKKQLVQMQQDLQEKERLIDMLTFQIADISDANLTLGEEEALLSEKQLVLNAEKIALAINTAHHNLSSSGKAMDLLFEAKKALSDISSYDPKYAQFESVVSDAYYSLEDISFDLSDSLETIVYDPERIEEIESRLALIASLKRKYGKTIEEILAFKEKASSHLQALKSSEETMDSLSAQVEESYSAFLQQCELLTCARKESAKRFESALVKELVELGMPAAKFSVLFEKESPTENGQDKITFYITVNKGEVERPLSKVASGGEASRIMLAINAIYAEHEEVDTLIFDEIDSGISGHMAHVVSEKLATISKSRQVICVSHLPQLAAMGDTNFKIIKTSTQSETITTVHKLSNEQKLKEIARLSGGIETDTALLHANELIEKSNQYKSEL